LETGLATVGEVVTDMELGFGIALLQLVHWKEEVTFQDPPNCACTQNSSSCFLHDCNTTGWWLDLFLFQI
jgi:hypothetical protein